MKQGELKGLRSQRFWLPMLASIAGSLLVGYTAMSRLRISPASKSTVVPAPSPVLATPPSASTTREFAVPVLMYHRICELTPAEARSPLVRDLTVSPTDFEAQVRYLAEQRFAFLLASEVEDAVRSGKPLPERAVAITMDDGYKDNFERAYPILRKYAAKATIFLVTSTVDTAGHLAWNDVFEMRRECTGYGSHTVHHFDLPELTEPQMDYELRESKRVIEGKLAEQITSVAYPSGRYNQIVTQRAEAAGYLAGWKKGGGPVQPGADPYLLPRVRVQGHTTLRDFERKVLSGVHVIADRAYDREEQRRRLAAKNRLLKQIALR